jgi:ribosomal-protein-alanine N-acetyltransferase
MRLTLETKRLILRPFELSDAEAMFKNWASDDEVTKYMTWNSHESIETTKMILNIWLEEYEKPERINFGIVLKDTNELIGGIDVCGYIDGVPVVGYVLSRKYWNNGYMTEALKKLVVLLKSLGHNQIKIDAMIENIGSNKVIQKCGGRFIMIDNEEVPLKQKVVKVNRYIIDIE